MNKYKHHNSHLKTFPSENSIDILLEVNADDTGPMLRPPPILLILLIISNCLRWEPIKFLNSQKNYEHKQTSYEYYRGFHTIQSLMFHFKFYVVDREYLRKDDQEGITEFNWLMSSWLKKFFNIPVCCNLSLPFQNQDYYQIFKEQSMYIYSWKHWIQSKLSIM